MSPLPTSRVIHPRMLPSLRPVAQGAQTASCTVKAPQTGPGTFNETTGRYTPTAGATLYSGPCRVQALARRGAEPALVGDNPQTLMLYQVTLPWSAAAVTVDCTVALTAGYDDELLTKTLRVVEVAYADLQAERRLLCQLNEG